MPDFKTLDTAFSKAVGGKTMPKRFAAALFPKKRTPALREPGSFTGWGEGVGGWGHAHPA